MSILTDGYCLKPLSTGSWLCSHKESGDTEGGRGPGTTLLPAVLNPGGKRHIPVQAGVEPAG